MPCDFFFLVLLCDFFVENWAFESNNAVILKIRFFSLPGFADFCYCVFKNCFGGFSIVGGCLFAKDRPEV